MSEVPQKDYRKLILGGSIVLGLGLVSYLAWRIFKKKDSDWETMSVSDGSKRTSRRKPKYSIKEDENEVGRSTMDFLALPTDSERSKEDSYYIRGTEDLALPIYTSKQYKFKQLSYNIFIRMTKGLGYYGAVRIKFTLGGFLKRDLLLEYNGTAIIRLAINGRVIPEKEVRYGFHRITLPGEYLSTENNVVEIYFCNKYSFFDDGLSTYFKIDQSNRYSLKEQCIYSKSNKYTIPRIIPCFNQKTPCDVEVAIIHSESCIAFSNSDKKSIRSFNESQYPQYDFMFTDGKKTINHSSKLSSRSLKETTRNITEFYKIKLNSIQDLFICSLPVVEAKVNHQLFSSVRFYCKKQLTPKLSAFGDYILNQIDQDFKNKKGYIPDKKIDFLIIDSDNMNGYFSHGIFILNERALEKEHKNKKIHYLVLRAFASKFIPPLNFEATITLNRDVAKIFPEFIGYLRMQQLKFKEIFNVKVSSDYGSIHEELYGRALKYYCPGLVTNSKIVQELMAVMEEKNPAKYWSYFYLNSEEIDIQIRELLIQLSIRNVGKPPLQIQEKLSVRFANTQSWIYFIKEDEIINNLSILISKNSRRLQLVINILDIQKIQREEGDKLGGLKQLRESSVYQYTSTPYNIKECEQLYHNFLEFDEYDNFHKLEIINEEIRRIKQVIKIEKTDRLVQCSLVPALILSRLGIQCVKNQKVAYMIQILNQVVDLE